eukprot:1039487-Prorocentrum_minimum.AAC.1
MFCAPFDPESVDWNTHPEEPTLACSRLQYCIPGYSRLFRGYSGAIPGLFRGYSGAIPGPPRPLDPVRNKAFPARNTVSWPFRVLLV